MGRYCFAALVWMHVVLKMMKYFREYNAATCQSFQTIQFQPIKYWYFKYQHILVAVEISILLPSNPINYEKNLQDKEITSTPITLNLNRQASNHIGHRY